MGWELTRMQMVGNVRFNVTDSVFVLIDRIDG